LSRNQNHYKQTYILYQVGADKMLLLYDLPVITTT